MATPSRASRATGEWRQHGERSREELEAEATQQSELLVDETLEALRITEATQEVAGSTLGALHRQGEQLQRIQDRTVETGEALATGEGLVGRLGGWFDPWRVWWTKRGPMVTGSREYADDRNAAVDRESRLGLGLDSDRRGGLGPRPNTEGLSGPEAVQANVSCYDSALDAIIDNLGDLTATARQMGDVMGQQDAQIEDISENVITLRGRVEDANERAGRIQRRS